MIPLDIIVVVRCFSALPALVRTIPRSMMRPQHRRRLVCAQNDGKWPGKCTAGITEAHLKSITSQGVRTQDLFVCPSVLFTTASSSHRWIGSSKPDVLALLTTYSTEAASSLHLLYQHRQHNDHSTEAMHCSAMCFGPTAYVQSSRRCSTLPRGSQLHHHPHMHLHLHLVHSLLPLPLPHSQS